MQRGADDQETHEQVENRRTAALQCGLSLQQWRRASKDANYSKQTQSGNICMFICRRIMHPPSQSGVVKLGEENFPHWMCEFNRQLKKTSPEGRMLHYRESQPVLD